MCPNITKRQKDELIGQYEQNVKDLAKRAIAEMTRSYEMELTAESLVTLHEEFGFNEEQPKLFTEKFTEKMRAYADWLDGAASVGEGALHVLRNYFPDVDEWLG